MPQIELKLYKKSEFIDSLLYMIWWSLAIEKFWTKILEYLNLLYIRLNASLQLF